MGISCIGIGQQRYKFQDEGKKFDATNGNARNRNALVLHDKSFAAQPSRSPSNPMTALASAFVNRIYPLGDIRYQLPANFGNYLADVPRHLGVSPALDAASDALVAAHARFCAGQSAPEHEVLTKYSRALSALRQELDDEVKAQSAENLCAIMLLMIVQVSTSRILYDNQLLSYHLVHDMFSPSLYD